MTKLSLRRGPLRLVRSRSLWRSAWYLLGYLAVGWFLFAVAAAAGGRGAARHSGDPGPAVLTAPLDSR